MTMDALLYRAVKEDRDFEGKRVTLTALDAIPEQHRRHAPYVERFHVVLFPGVVRFETCGECGIGRGFATGPMPDKPIVLYAGESPVEALDAFHAGEQRMLAGAS